MRLSPMQAPLGHSRASRGELLACGDAAVQRFAKGGFKHCYGLTLAEDGVIKGVYAT